MADRSWLYLYDGKLRGVGIDLVAEQQLRAFSEAARPVELVSRGRLTLPYLQLRRWGFPPTKLLSWLPSQDYYAVNKRFFSLLGRHYFDGRRHCGVIAWSKSALKVFEAAAQAGLSRILNVGNFHCDFEAGGKVAPSRWPRIEKARLRREYELATRILVASDFAAETFLENGVSAAKLAVIYRGVDAERFRPDTERRSSPFVVASCGSLGERKGTYQLLHAWSALELPDAELWLIGTIPREEGQKMRELASSSVRFLGFRRDVPQLLAQAHVHVLLSRHEGFAKVLLEAAACGVANVCTRETGLPLDAPGAVLVGDRSDASEVGAILQGLHADRSGCERLGREARTWAEASFTWQHFRYRFRAALPDASRILP
jgi:glycosyltransferase involved in cell wall biosynthesis